MLSTSMGGGSDNVDPRAVVFDEMVRLAKRVVVRYGRSIVQGRWGSCNVRELESCGVEDCLCVLREGSTLSWR